MGGLEIQTVTKITGPESNLKTWLKIELTYNKSAVDFFNHYAMGNPSD